MLNLKNKTTAKTATKSSQFEVTSGDGWSMVVEAYTSKKGEQGTICKHIGSAIHFKGLSASSMATLIDGYGDDYPTIMALVQSVLFAKEVNAQLKANDCKTLDDARNLFA